jgi:prolipoprotein diacylglyceryl transferase
MYLIGLAVCIALTVRRWRAQGGSADLVYEVALWSFPAGLVGARVYFDLTTPDQIPSGWWGPLAIWDGGLGVWGGIAAGTLVGAWVVNRRGESVAAFMDAVAPGLLLAQAIGRLGNWFNQELFGRPTSLPWGLEIDPAHRPARYADSPTFQPTFLYELIWDVALAIGLIVLGRRRRIHPPGLFCLYVAGYSAFRIVEELMRVDPSARFLGQRLNLYVASLLVVAGLVGFWISQRRPLAATPDEGPPARAAAKPPASAAVD